MPKDKNRDERKEQIVRVKKEQIDTGHNVFNVLYGYEFKYNNKGKKEWVIVEKEAEVIKKIFSLYNNGKSYGQIKDSLNEAGYRTKFNKAWSIPTVKKLLRHPEYFGNTKNTSGEIIPGKVYPKILDGKFVRMPLQEFVAEGGGMFYRYRNTNSLLSGLIKCGECKSHYYMHVSQHFNKTLNIEIVYSHYFHKSVSQEQKDCENDPTYIKQGILDAIVLLLYFEVFSDMNEVSKYLGKMKNDIFLEDREVIVKINELKKELLQIEKGRKELLVGVQSGNLTNEDLTPLIRELNEEKSRIKTTIARLESMVSSKKERYEEYLKTYTFNHLVDFSRAPIEKQRKYYQEAIETFEVLKGKIRIVFITGVQFDFNVESMEDYRRKLGARAVKGAVKAVLGRFTTK